MKLARTNAVLLALATALFLLGWLLAPDELARRGEGAALFPGLAAADVDAVVVRARDGTRSVRLERADDGWVLPEHSSFPASAWPADELLVHLPAIRATDLIASGGGDTYGLAGESAVEVELLDSAGATLAAFDQASAAGFARGGRASGSVLRVRGEEAVYRAPLVPALAAKVESWLELSLAKVSDARPSEALRVAVLRDGERVVEIARDGEAGARWLAVHPREAVVPALRAEALLAALERLHLDRIEAAEPLDEHGLATPALRFILTLPGAADGAPRSVRLDLVASADGGHLATSPDWRAPWVVHLPPQALDEAERALGALVAALR